MCLVITTEANRSQQQIEEAEAAQRACEEGVAEASGCTEGLGGSPLLPQQGRAGACKDNDTSPGGLPAWKKLGGWGAIHR